MNKTILNRLTALEASQPVEYQPPSPWPMIFHKLIAFHLGQWDRQKDSPAEAYARAQRAWHPDRAGVRSLVSRASGANAGAVRGERALRSQRGLGTIAIRRRPSWRRGAMPKNGFHRWPASAVRDSFSLFTGAHK
jgi:hypothetical protein